MANMHLVTGYAGKEHVTSADHGVFHSYLFGTDQFVFDRGNKLAANIESNNLIRVLDGDIYIQGRHVRLNEDKYVDLIIDNGEQGMQRNDLIVARYTKDSMTGVEEVNLVVIKGTSAASDPADPEYTEGDILGGALLHDMPLYRVPLDGLNVGELVPLFETFGNTIPALVALINALYTAVSGKAASSHKHGAGDITSGILPVARGGTGVSSLDALAAKIPGAKIDLLWTNASPTSTFGAQTISMNLSEYTIFIVEAYNPSYSSHVAVKGHETITHANNIPYSNMANGYTRKVTFSDSGIVFSGGYWGTYGSGANNKTNDSYMIPQKIFGIKGVS